MRQSKILRTLTIAGSDSSGGAGIQADLKTFAALGVYGMTVVTTVTAQNTVDIVSLHDVPPDIVKSQIHAVVEDIGVDAAKTGMLHSEEIIDVVARELGGEQFPLVVDPVMATKRGSPLITPGAIGELVEKILPLANVLTPNAHEAEILSGIKIQNLEDAKKAAVKISKLGPKSVVVKGGHIPGNHGVTDVLYTDGKFELFGSEVVVSETGHGTGCSFASAITARLAWGDSISDAVRVAKEFITKAIRFGLQIGKGNGPVNPTAWLENEAKRFETWKNVLDAVRLLESTPRMVNLVPEVQMNLVMATPNATSQSDVVGIPGRIVRLPDRVKASSCPEFGASRHVASMVLTAMRRNPSIRAGMNIRYSEEILDVCKNLGFSIASYDRRKEPKNLKKVDGATIPWGTRQAMVSIGFVPDIIYHSGDWGKEAVATILSDSAIEAVKKALKIAEELRKIRKVR